MQDSTGYAQAGVAAGVGLALALSVPVAMAGLDATWQRITALALALACVLMLVAAVVLGLVAAMRSRVCQDESLDRLLTLADVFLISAVGLVAVDAVFLFVLAVIRMA